MAYTSADVITIIPNTFPDIIMYYIRCARVRGPRTAPSPSLGSLGGGVIITIITVISTAITVAALLLLSWFVVSLLSYYYYHHYYQ